VDLNEAGQRIFRRHWALILLLVWIGVIVPVVIAKAQPAQYAATARVDLGADAHGSQEANSLADTALAVATSPAVLSTALKTAKVDRDQATVITELQVVPVGTSAVLDMTVTDPDAHASAALVNALAATVVKVRDADAFGGTQQLLAQLQQQSTAVAQQIASIEAQIGEESAAPAFTPSAVQARSAALASLAIEHQTLLAQQSRLDGQRQQLTQDLATAQRPVVVDASQKTGLPADGSLAVRMAVGGLLGLILGIALAAMLEVLRPTLNIAALSRRLGAPVLARLNRTPGATSVLDDPWAVNYVTAAAASAGVRTVYLAPVGRHPVDVSGLARSLDGHNGLRVLPLLLPGDSRKAQPPATPVEKNAGIVVVAPKVVKGNALRALDRHLDVTKERVIGIIAYRGGADAPAETEVTERDAAFRESVSTEASTRTIPAQAPAPASAQVS
jgi:capsular polysaccharide biosynthesis protein